MTIKRPAHPMETGLGTILETEWHTDMPATVKQSGPRTTMRPVADDYQYPQQGVTSASHGFDSDVPTDEWQPDPDYAHPRDNVPPIAAPIIHPPVDVHLVPGPQVGVYTYAQFRTVFGATESYSGALLQPDRTTIRQLLSFDLGRTTATIRSEPSLAPGGGGTAQYVFAISASKDFPQGEYYYMQNSNFPVVIGTTNELWAAIVPLAAYDSTKANSAVLCVQSETARPSPLS